MVKTFNLLNGHSFVFITVVVVSLLFITIYMVIAPEPNTPYNFNPFPEVAPVDLPDPNRHTDTCWDKLTPCDAEGMCSSCSLDEYKCQTVTKTQGDKKHFHFNGINVPEGQWCIPKDDNPNPVCNEHTGKWLWVFDEEYCSRVNNGKSQCWKCECTYPSAFSDPDTGCVTQQICQNTSIRTHNKKQPMNKLQGTEYGPKENVGKTWDPLSGSDSTILEYSPYAKDEDGNPLFACTCDSNVGDQYFANLKDDPYSCHLAPCLGYFGNKEKAMNSSGVCECGTDTALSPNGQWANTCVSISGSCGNFSYDKDSEKCTCAEPWWETPCKSKLVNQDRTDLKECLEFENALGTECRNPCEGKTCDHETICVSDNAWESHCDCTTSKEPAKHPWQFSGPTCANRCLVNGTIIKKRQGFGMNWCYRCSCCCSEDSHRRYNVLNSWYKEECSNKDPPNPQGSGPCGYKCGSDEIHGGASC